VPDVKPSITPALWAAMQLRKFRSPGFDIRLAQQALKKGRIVSTNGLARSELVRSGGFFLGLRSLCIARFAFSRNATVVNSRRVSPWRKGIIASMEGPVLSDTGR
jgi:hypothetical protein